MKRDLQCPECGAERFIPVWRLFAYRRNWLGRWRKVAIADIARCEHCRAELEISDMGLSLHAKSPLRKAEGEVERNGAGKRERDDEPREPVGVLRGAVTREVIP